MKTRRLFIRTVTLLIMAIAIGYTFYSNFFSDADAAVRVGDEAPNFVLTDLNGNEVELEDYRGQGVFLNFWGTYCPPCEREMPYMENQYAIYKDQGVEILAVNVGEPELTVQRFVERLNLTFPIPMDKGQQVLDRYGVIPLPTTFLINAEGEIINIITGGMTEQAIAQYMESIKPQE
ncbi:thiol-disulfide oxidoreductase (plasmid) [Alkalihalophilus pseudofirmus OF4]|uniref:Thiol-disulfide oxidoreductase n=1 Tax=Alkalihalophilus pseudofirmus (strain ATCC BAA-2126 / JCM 17055 / OF4) TaxID=398511 RepID=D3G163_ALKPO|nr:thiol-disulfide oxidoreductase ResA [Alkalihalophilus pseudofirmus]ADC52089.1 thiol-disulfide oxidoreductase [Alkalihalophilus pseudofirmus OF4]